MIGTMKLTRGTSRMTRSDMGKGEIGFQMMGDVFAFLKQYGKAEKDDAYWKKVWDKHNALCEKYKGNEEIKHLLIHILSGIEFHLEEESKRL